MNDVYPRKSALIYAAAAILALVLVSVLTVRASSAAFSDTTDNSANTWSAGTVTLTDDDGGATAMYSATNMKPGDGSTECITVTYSGTLDASVKVFGAVTAGTGLEDYLDLTVRRGSGGLFGDCTGFTSAEVVYTGTLGGFVTAHTNFATGAGSWTPTGGGADDDMTYEFSVTLQDNSAAQGLSATATITWEAQNT
jgi:hypothetical protein